MTLPQNTPTAYHRLSWPTQMGRHELETRDGPTIDALLGQAILQPTAGYTLVGALPT